MEAVNDPAARADAARGTARSSDRVLALLLALVEATGDGSGPNLTELAEDVGLAPSTALRQLGSLEAAGLVRRGEDGYRVGPALVRVAHRVVADHPITALAQPLLERAAATTGETFVLAVPHGDDRALYVAAADGTHTLRVTGWRGRDVPRADAAVGRALAGGDDDVPVVAVGTVEEGVTAVSDAVRGPDGPVVAAVSLLGPSTRVRGDALVRARRAVREVRVELEALLGR